MPRMDTNRDDVHIVSTGLPHYGLHYAYSIAGPAIKDRCIFNSYTSISQACGLGIKSAILTGQNHGSYDPKLPYLRPLSVVVLFFIPHIRSLALPQTVKLLFYNTLEFQ